jgi:predicted metal-dependent phosphotriesterase family hydrolase
MQPHKAGFIRTVLGDRDALPAGAVFGHEHLIIDSPLIHDRFPHIHLYDVESAVAEVGACRDAGVALMVDAMPVAAGRDAVRLAEISRRTGVDIISATGLHHDRYYGPLHWSNRVGLDDLVALFVADLTEGIDELDYTGPVIRRSPHKAGIVKVATSGQVPDQRDLRNLEAAAHASNITGAPILTHCEGGLGGLAQVQFLLALGVRPGSIILSHVDKSHALNYLQELAASGVILELDQGLREREQGLSSVTVRAVYSLVEAGFGHQVIVGTDGARRDLWASLGGAPGLSWLASEFPVHLKAAGLDEEVIQDVMRNNAVSALSWRAPAADRIEDIAEELRR